jgi:hypothetical protein
MKKKYLLTWIKKIGVCGALLALLLPLSSASSAAPWSANQRVALTDTSIEERPRLAAAPDGEMQVVYSLEYDIYAATRLASSSNWNTPVKITDAGRSLALTPDVAVASDGTIYTVWTDKRSNFNNDIYFSRSSDHGATWSVNQNIIPEINRSPNQVEPVIAVDPRTENSGVIYVASFENPSSGQMFIDFSSSTNRGNSWTFQQLSYPVGSNIYKIGSLAMEVDTYGRIYLMFDELVSGETRIFFTTSIDGGQTWEDMLPLTPAFDGCLVVHHPSMSLGNSDVVYVAYVQTNHSGCDNGETVGVNLKLIVSANGGQNWETPILVGPPTQPQDILQTIGVAVVPGGYGVTDDEIVVAWSDNSPKFQLYSISSKDGGTSWDTPIKISDAANPENINANFPQLAVSKGIVHALWRDARTAAHYMPYMAKLQQSSERTSVFLPLVNR